MPSLVASRRQNTDGRFVVFTATDALKSFFYVCVCVCTWVCGAGPAAVVIRAGGVGGGGGRGVYGVGGGTLPSPPSLIPPLTKACFFAPLDSERGRTLPRPPGPNNPLFTISPFLL